MRLADRDNPALYIDDDSVSVIVAAAKVDRSTAISVEVVVGSPVVSDGTPTTIAGAAGTGLGCGWRPAGTVLQDRERGPFGSGGGLRRE